MSQSISRPAPVRFAAAALTAATATLLLLQLMREGQADEAPPPVRVRAATAPEVRVAPTADHPVVLPEDTVLPTKRVPGPVDTVLVGEGPMHPATPPTPRSSARRASRSALRGFLPVKDFGGY